MDLQELLDFYTWYYRAAQDSPTYATFCQRVFGLNCAQHGFADISQVNSLLAFLNLRAGDQVLELGCGNGGMAAYIAEMSGAYLTGIDLIPEAIRQAKKRTRGREKYLAFKIMDIAALDFPPESFDALISIDSLYFTEMNPTIQAMKQVLRKGGQMGILYSHGVSPTKPAATFDLRSLHPDRTPLANALQENGLRYKVWDYTAEDYTHALLKKKVSEELRSGFESEGNLSLYKNRHDEAVGVMSAIEADAHKRYLYHIVK